MGDTIAYIYLIQDGGDRGTFVYKVGRTVQTGGDSRKIHRLQSYSKGTVQHNVWKVNPISVIEIEDSIKCKFHELYKLVRGTEWFEGNVKDMKMNIDSIVNALDKEIIHVENVLPSTTRKTRRYTPKPLPIHRDDIIKRVEILEALLAQRQHVNATQKNAVKVTVKNDAVVLRDYGMEDLDYITNDKDLLDWCFEYRDIGQLIDKIYFNWSHPENHTIRYCYDKVNGGWTFEKYQNNNWYTIHHDELYRDMINKVFNILRVYAIHTLNPSTYCRCCKYDYNSQMEWLQKGHEGKEVLKKVKNVIFGSGFKLKRHYQ
jgi:hypothetical protein